MKLLKLILVGSVVLNAGLAAAYVVRNHSGSSSSPEVARQAATAKPSPPAEIWARIDTTTSKDPTSLVAQLRAEGFPPEIVRAIVRAKLWEQFDAKRKALGGDNENREYWKSYSVYRSGSAETRAAQRKLYKEFTDQMRELLGDDTSISLEKAMEERRYGDLPKEKIEQLKLVVQDYDELKSQVQSEARGVLLPEDREKLAYLQKEQQTDLAALLSPEELEQYELRNSRTANQLKARINLFDATEQEYVALYKLQKAFDDKYAQPENGLESVGASQNYKVRSEAQKQLNKNIEAALGAERYREYQIKTDYEYRQVSQLAERLKLPDTVAQQVVSLKLETQEKMQAIRTELSGTANTSRDQAMEQLQARTAVLAQEVATKLEQALGPEGYAAYKDRAKNWVPTIRTTKK